MLFYVCYFFCIYCDLVDVFSDRWRLKYTTSIKCFHINISFYATGSLASSRNAFSCSD